jgi:hypothetical protein
MFFDLRFSVSGYLDGRGKYVSISGKNQKINDIPIKRTNHVNNQSKNNHVKANAMQKKAHSSGIVQLVV